MTESDRVGLLFLCSLLGAFLLFVWGLSICLAVDGPLYSPSVLWQMAKGAPVVCTAIGVAKAGIRMQELHESVVYLHEQLHEIGLRRSSEAHTSPVDSQ